MTHVDQKLSFSLHEVCKENKPSVTYDELLKLADNMEMQTMIAMDDYIALEMEYGDNYTKKDLDKIAEYYEISKRKKKKQDLIEAVVLFEKMPENVEVVYTRKRLWGYIQEIKADKYLNKYLIFD
jgi:hypothetical protein